MRAATKGSNVFTKRNNFRTRSCLEQLLLFNNYFLVTNTFSDQLLLEVKILFQYSYCFGGTTFLE